MKTFRVNYTVGFEINIENDDVVIPSDLKERFEQLVLPKIIEQGYGLIAQNMDVLLTVPKEKMQ